MLSIKKQNLINLIVYFFIISNVLDPTGEIGLKYFSFFLLVFGCFLKPSKFKPSLLVFFGALICFFGISTLLTVINDGNISMSFLYNLFIPTTILLIIISEIIEKNKILEFVMNTLFYSSLMIISGNFFSFIFPNETILSILKFFAANFDTYEDLRSSSMVIVPKIYFHFTLFLPSAFIYFLFNNKHIKSLLIGVAIVLSLSRVAILVSGLFLIIYFLKNKNIKSFLLNSFLACIFFFVFIYIIDIFVPNIFIHFLNLNDSSQFTVATRLGQLNDLNMVFSENLLYFLFGMGSGTPIYSNFLAMEIYNIEIAPLEIIRKYGIVFFTIIFSLMFKIIFQNFKIDISKSFLMISLLLCTFSNPILTAPIFIFIFILCNNKSLKKI